MALSGTISNLDALGKWLVQMCSAQTRDIALQEMVVEADTRMNRRQRTAPLDINQGASSTSMQPASATRSNRWGAARRIRRCRQCPRRSVE